MDRSSPKNRIEPSKDFNRPPDENLFRAARILNEVFPECPYLEGPIFLEDHWRVTAWFSFLPLWKVELVWSEKNLTANIQQQDLLEEQILWGKPDLVGWLSVIKEKYFWNTWYNTPLEEVPEQPPDRVFKLDDLDLGYRATLKDIKRLFADPMSHQQDAPRNLDVQLSNGSQIHLRGQEQGIQVLAHQGSRERISLTSLVPYNRWHILGSLYYIRLALSHGGDLAYFAPAVLEATRYASFLWPTAPIQVDPDCLITISRPRDRLFLTRSNASIETTGTNHSPASLVPAPTRIRRDMKRFTIRDWFTWVFRNQT